MAAQKKIDPPTPKATAREAALLKLLTLSLNPREVPESQMYMVLNPAILPGNDRYQLWVKLAVSVIGPFMITDAGLSVPEKEPVPVPLQLVKL